MSWNDGQCGLWILVNTAHYFPHVETIFIGHIYVNYPLLECGCWIHNCICAWSSCHIANTSITVHLRFWSGSLWTGEFTFHFFSFHIYIMSLYPTQWWSQVYVWQLCVIIVVLSLTIILTLFFVIKLVPGFQMLCMNMVRTLGCVHIVIIPSITRFQTGKNLTV